MFIKMNGFFPEFYLKNCSPFLMPKNGGRQEGYVGRGGGEGVRQHKNIIPNIVFPSFKRINLPKR